MEMDREMPFAPAVRRFIGRFITLIVIIAPLIPAAHADTLLVHSIPDPAWVQDIQTKLAATGRLTGRIDAFNARDATPALATLQAYDAIMLIGSSAWSNATALGNTVANYVDAGGGLVITFQTLANRPATGRLTTGGYYPILPGAVAGQFTRLNLETVHAPLHPVIAGVNTLDGGSNSFHSDGGLAPGAIRIADWSNGQPLAAALGGFAAPVVALNFFPVSSDGRVDFWDPATDGAILMANALNHAAGLAPPGGSDPADPPAAVPLPAAAGAGLALLGGIAAARSIRRRTAAGGKTPG